MYGFIATVTDVQSARYMFKVTFQSATNIGPETALPSMQGTQVTKQPIADAQRRTKEIQ